MMYKDVAKQSAHALDLENAVHHHLSDKFKGCIVLPLCHMYVYSHGEEHVYNQADYCERTSVGAVQERRSFWPCMNTGFNVL